MGCCCVTSALRCETLKIRHGGGECEAQKSRPMTFPCCHLLFITFSPEINRVTHLGPDIINQTSKSPTIVISRPVPIVEWKVEKRHILLGETIVQTIFVSRVSMTR